MHAVFVEETQKLCFFCFLKARATMSLLNHKTRELFALFMFVVAHLNKSHLNFLSSIS